MLSTTRPLALDQQRPVFDQELSSTLDLIQIQLDAQTGLTRRTVLKLRKRWIERSVPAFMPQQQTEAW